VLHSIFWKNLSPNGGGKPTGELASAIDRDFGSFGQVQSAAHQGCGTCMGSGWGALVFDTASRTLLTAQFHDHGPTTQGGLPLLFLVPGSMPGTLQYLE